MTRVRYQRDCPQFTRRVTLAERAEQHRRAVDGVDGAWVQCGKCRKGAKAEADMATDEKAESDSIEVGGVLVGVTRVPYGQDAPRADPLPTAPGTYTLPAVCRSSFVPHIDPATGETLHRQESEPVASTPPTFPCDECADPHPLRSGYRVPGVYAEISHGECVEPHLSLRDGEVSVEQTESSGAGGVTFPCDICKAPVSSSTGFGVDECTECGEPYLSLGADSVHLECVEHELKEGGPCPKCGAKLATSKGPGRTRSYRGETGYAVPDEIEYPECPECHARWMTVTQLKSLSEALESQRRARLLLTDQKEPGPFEPTTDVERMHVYFADAQVGAEIAEFQRDEAMKRAEKAEADLAAARQDVVDAAGELLVPIPEPGSEAAKLLSANALVRRERDEANERARKAEAELETSNRRAEQAEHERDQRTADASMALEAMSRLRDAIGAEESESVADAVNRVVAERDEALTRAGKAEVDVKIERETIAMMLRDLRAELHYSDEESALDAVRRTVDELAEMKTRAEKAAKELADANAELEARRIAHVELQESYTRLEQSQRSAAFQQQYVADPAELLTELEEAAKRVEKAEFLATDLGLKLQGAERAIESVRAELGGQPGDMTLECAHRVMTRLRELEAANGELNRELETAKTAVEIENRELLNVCEILKAGPFVKSAEDAAKRVMLQLGCMESEQEISRDRMDELKARAEKAEAELETARHGESVNNIAYNEAVQTLDKVKAILDQATGHPKWRIIKAARRVAARSAISTAGTELVASLPKYSSKAVESLVNARELERSGAPHLAAVLTYAALDAIMHEVERLKALQPNPKAKRAARKAAKS